MDTNRTAVLAEFCAMLSPAALSSAVQARTCDLVLDLIGSIVRARSASVIVPSLLDAVEALGWRGGNHHVFGAKETYASCGATFLNGALAHALDFDDTHAAGTLHPGAAVIPAAIAAAEMVGATGIEVLTAIVAGYEVACRAALALPAGAHYQRGFHPTATCGVFGAAAAAGRVFGLSPALMESALGLALSQSAGSLQFLTDGAWTKPFQVGWASMAGLAAATLSRSGYRGTTQALDGRHGFLQAYAPDPVPGTLTDGLGDQFEIMATAVKPYPSCRYGHAGIDAALALRIEHGIDPADVTSVTYGVSRAGLLLVGEPAHIKQQPQNLVGAQFSAPFVIATALATGRMGWDSYDNLDDPALRALMLRVHCEHDDEMESHFPRNMSGRLTVTTPHGRFTKAVVVPSGEPANFLSAQGLRDKFLSLARPVISGRADALADAVLRLPELKSVDELTRLAAPAG